MALDHLTITDIAIHLGVSRWTVSRLVEAGEIPSTPGRGRWPLISTSDYRTWLNAQVVTPGQEAGSMTDLPELIAFESVAEKWGLSLRSLKEQARAKKFTHIRHGQKRYFTPDQLDAFLGARTVTSAEDSAKTAMAARRDRRQSRTGRTAA
ncbi:helix-turn-helix domain-containing protein [Actinoplanes sp. CA-054009]